MGERDQNYRGSIICPNQQQHLTIKVAGGTTMQWCPQWEGRSSCIAKYLTCVYSMDIQGV